MAHQTRRAPADRDAPYRALDRIALLYALKPASRDRLRERHSTGADDVGPDDRAVSAPVLLRARALVLVCLRRLFGYPRSGSLPLIRVQASRGEREGAERPDDRRPPAK
jgi:hypothetical protein